MDVQIRVDIKPALAALSDFQKRHVPFATSRALNDCADQAVKDLAAWVQTIFNFRGNASWVRWRWFRSKWSNKYNLTAYVQGILDYLVLHERGGLRLPHSRPTLCIPLGSLRMRRIPAQLRPSFLLGNDFQGLLKTSSMGVRTRKKRMQTWGRAFLFELRGRHYIAMRGTNAGIPLTAKRFQGISLLYHLVPAVRIPRRLRMAETIRGAVQREFAGCFRRRLLEAMRTAR